MKLASVTYQQQQRIAVVQENGRCFVLNPELNGIPETIEAYLGSESAQLALANLAASGFEGAVEGVMR